MQKINVVQKTPLLQLHHQFSECHMNMIHCKNGNEKLGCRKIGQPEKSAMKKQCKRVVKRLKINVRNKDSGKTGNGENGNGKFGNWKIRQREMRE